MVRGRPTRAQRPALPSSPYGVRFRAGFLRPPHRGVPPGPRGRHPDEPSRDGVMRAHAYRSVLGRLRICLELRGELSGTSARRGVSLAEGTRELGGECTFGIWAGPQVYVAGRRFGTLGGRWLFLGRGWRDLGGCDLVDQGRRGCALPRWGFVVVRRQFRDFWGGSRIKRREALVCSLGCWSRHFCWCSDRLRWWLGGGRNAWRAAGSRADERHRR